MASIDTTYIVNYNNSTLASTAATGADVVLFSLAARQKITGLTIKTVTAFTGTGLTALTVAVTVAGGTTVMTPYSAATAYSPVYDVMAAAGNTNYYDDGGQASATEATHNVVARFTATGANLNVLTAGSLEITVSVMTRPAGTVVP
jgi:hypothetical protein